MTVPRRLLTPREAAQMMGISYPTIKKFILNGKLKTVKTPGGHHRLTAESINAYLERRDVSPKAELHGASLRMAGINELRGEVVSIRFSGLIAEVVLALGEQQITAIISADAATELQLAIGDVATALINSNAVMIARLDEGPGQKE